MAFIIILLFYILSSCSSDIEYYVDEAKFESKSMSEPVTIINDANGITIHIDSCSASKTNPLLLEYGDTIAIEQNTRNKEMLYLYGSLFFGDMLAYKGKMIAPENPIIVSLLCDSLGERLLYTASFDISIEDWYN